jgi:hypothetical protein
VTLDFSMARAHADRHGGKYKSNPRTSREVSRASFNALGNAARRPIPKLAAGRYGGR